MNTEREEAIAKLEAVHSFPCEYPFKLIGANRPALVGAALAEVRAILPDLEPTVTRRESRHGKHQSITVTLTVPNAESVLLIYERLRTLSDVYMLL